MPGTTKPPTTRPPTTPPPLLGCMSGYRLENMVNPFRPLQNMTVSQTMSGELPVRQVSADTVVQNIPQVSGTTVIQNTSLNTSQNIMEMTNLCVGRPSDVGYTIDPYGSPIISNIKCTAGIPVLSDFVPGLGGPAYARVKCVYNPGNGTASNPGNLY